MIRLKVMGHIQTRTAVSMKDSFTWISRMEKEPRCGLMVLNTMVSTRMGRRMDEVYSSGQMAVPITANSLTTTSRERGSIGGRMVESTKEAGLIIRCTVSAHLTGQMEGGTRARITMTRRRAWGRSFGPTRESMRAAGSMESSMASATSYLVLINQGGRVNGRMGKELSG